MPIYSNRPRGPAGGDLSGSYPDPQVINLSGSATGSFSGSFVGDGSGLVNLPVVSSSHILYVSADSTDTGADGSFNKPFATISASLAYAKTTYTSAEHVEIFLNPGRYPTFTLDRHNTYIKSDLSHERQRGATINGPVVINCSGSNQKYNQIVGFDGLFITGPSNSTEPTVYLTGSGAHLTYFKDCFLYSTTNTSHIFKCDTDFDTHKTIFKDSTFLPERSGSSFLRLNGGDIEFNTCRLQANITGSGTFVSGSGDLYIMADRLFVDTYTNGNIFEVSSSRSLALVVANSSLSTYGTGKPVSAPLNAVLVGNNFFGGAIANNFNVSALAVSYSNLSSITASNPVTISASVLPLPMWETHGNIIASSLTASLKGNGSQVTNLTASNITNFTADVRNQFTAGANIGISGGVISVTGSTAATVLTSGSITGSGVTGDEVRLKDTISVTSITASNGLYDYIDFNTSSIDPGFRTGRFHYGTGSGDIEYDTDINGVTLKIGQQTILKVHNNYGSTLSKGRLVRFTAGNSSAVPFATTASWVSEDESAHTIGMVMADIATGQNGYIILEGVLVGVNTAAYGAGDLLFLSSSGLFSNTPPPAGASYHGVRVGQVVRSGNSNTGAVFVKVDNGYEINELHDTDIVSPTHGDLFMRSGSVNGSAQWINTKQLSGSYGLTGSLYAVGNLSASAGVTGSFSGSGASLDLFSTINGTRGVVPGSNDLGNSYFLRADGVWALQPYGQFTLSGSQIYSSAATTITGFSQDLSSSISQSNGLFYFSESGRYLISMTGRFAATGISADNPEAISINTKYGTDPIDTTYISSETNIVLADRSYIVSRTQLVDVATLSKRLSFEAQVIGGTSVTGSWENVGSSDGSFGHNLKVVITKV